MKQRKYEQNSLIFLIVILTILLEGIFTLILTDIKEYKYLKLTGIVMKKDKLLVMINEKEKKVIYKNSYLYVNNNKRNYKVIDDKRIIMKDKSKYYEVILNYKFDKRYKSNDTISISIKDKKYHLIEMFKLIWDGDAHGENK